MHALITGWPRVDHRDGNGLNNQRTNLRQATALQNMWNRRKTAAAASRYKGVTWYRPTKRWTAAIRVGGRVRYLGYFRDEQAAARAYDTAAREVHGEFACLNFPPIRKG